MNEKTFIKIAKALADPTRHAIVREVREAGELTCSGVCERFSHSQPTISHHIKTLEASGVLVVRKDGAFHRLSVDQGLLEDFAKSVSGGEPAKKTRKRL